MLHYNERVSRDRVIVSQLLSRVVTLALVCFAVAFWAERAAAEETLPIAVAKFEGKRPDEVRAQVIKTLRAGGYVVADDDVTPAIDTKADSAAFVSMAEDGGFRGFILATTEKKKGWKTILTIREGRTGEVVGEVTLVGGWFPGLLKKVDTNLILEGKEFLDKTRGPDLSEYQQVAGEQKAEETDAKETSEEDKADEPPPEEEKQDASEPVEKAEPSPGSDIERRKSKDPALELQVGGMWMQRNWELIDPVNGPGGDQLLSAHDAPLPGFRVAAEVYPAAFFSKSAARHIGIEAMFARSLFARTEFPDADSGEAKNTVFLDLHFGLRGRIPLGKTFLGLFGGVGAGQLSVARDSDTIAHSDANYQFYRAGADYWLPLGTIAEGKISMAYRGVLSLGEGENEIQSARWYPDATGGALEGRLQLGLLLARNWSLRLGVTAHRYAFDFNQSPDTVTEAAANGDPEPALAAGATDTYWGADLGIALLVF